MHMADALLAPGVAGIMYALSGTAAWYAARKLKKEQNENIVPEMGVLGAFVFAAQMINFAIPGTGSSGHLCGGMLLSAVVGPYGGFLTLIGVLTLQCLLFGDGGLLALGANVWNMAFYGCFLGGGVIWPLLTRRGLSKSSITAARRFFRLPGDVPFGYHGTSLYGIPAAHAAHPPGNRVRGRAHHVSSPDLCLQ